MFIEGLIHQRPSIERIDDLQLTDLALSGGFSVDFPMTLL